MTSFSRSFAEKLKEIEARAKAAGSNMTQVCKTTGVARATYERWNHRAPQTVTKVDELMAEVERLEQKQQAEAVPQGNELKGRIYLAGPMTGLPDWNFPAFHAAAARLRSEGYHVENPAENSAPPCNSWEGYMRTAIAQLVTCDMIALLPGSENSRGATIEKQLAYDLGMTIIFLPSY